jgi:hypothetical protein
MEEITKDGDYRPFSAPSKPSDRGRLTLREGQFVLYTPWQYIALMEVQIHPFLTFALPGGGRSASCPGRLSPAEPGNWVGTGAE